MDGLDSGEEYYFAEEEMMEPMITSERTATTTPGTGIEITTACPSIATTTTTAATTTLLAVPANTRSNPTAAAGNMTANELESDEGVGEEDEDVNTSNVHHRLTCDEVMRQEGDHGEEDPDDDEEDDDENAIVFMGHEVQHEDDYDGFERLSIDSSNDYNCIACCSTSSYPKPRPLKSTTRAHQRRNKHHMNTSSNTTPSHTTSTRFNTNNTPASNNTNNTISNTMDRRRRDRQQNQQQQQQQSHHHQQHTNLGFNNSIDQSFSY